MGAGEAKSQSQNASEELLMAEICTSCPKMKVIVEEFGRLINEHSKFSLWICTAAPKSDKGHLTFCSFHIICFMSNNKGSRMHRSYQKSHASDVAPRHRFQYRLAAPKNDMGPATRNCSTSYSSRVTTNAVERIDGARKTIAAMPLRGS